MTPRAQIAAGVPAVTAAQVLLAVLAVFGSLGVTLAAGPLIPHTQLSFFYPAVMIAALLGGFILGIVAILLSIALAEWLVFSTFTADLVLTASRISVFALVAGGLAYLIDRLQRARALAQDRTAQAERLNEELVEQTTELEVQVTESEVLTNELEQVNAELATQTDAAHRAAIRSERLHQFMARLLGRVGAAGVARVIVEEGRLAVEALAAAVVTVRDDSSVDVVAAHGYSDQVLNPEAALYRGPTPVLDVIRSGEAIWLEDEATLITRYPGLAAQSKLGRAWAALPLEVDGRRIGALALSFDREGSFHPDDRSFMLLLAQQSAQALERARLHDMELRARVRAEFAERRLAFIAEASARLAASLDYLATLANLAHIAVPELADWCVVHLLDHEGVPRLIAAVHSDDATASRRRALEERYPASLQDRAPFAEVLRTGEPVHIDPLTDEQLKAVALDDHHLQELRALGVRNQLSVPILIEERAWGVVTLAHAESGRRFGDSDITLALELGRRAGNAVENAQLYQAAHHASETKSDFLAVMSHELRTPLNAIIGYSDLLLMGVPEGVPERARRQVERIRSASTSLLHLVEEVLSFSRVEAGKEEIRISPVDLGAVLRECVAMIEPLGAEKDLEIVVETPEQPLKVVSDERKIRQIVTNLLSNAVKFTEAGRITVSARAGDGEVLIAVCDTGIGISPEHLERVFDPFWQVEQSATRRFGGTGLGLGVARKLAKLLEGRLEVQSTEGKGSRFTLTLPLRTPGTQRHT